MARPVSFSEMKKRARYRADMTGSGFIDDTELGVYINDSAAELYDLLITKYGEDYFTLPVPYTISITTDQDQYDLPTDFYKMRGVDLRLGANEAITMKPFMFGERNRHRNNRINTWDVSGVSHARYRIIGKKIWFIPSPTGGFDVDLWYIPLLTPLEDADDEFDFINGWEEFAIVDAAIKMLRKEESDTRELELERQQIISRIDMAAGNRDAGESFRVQDTAAYSDGYFDGSY